MESQLQADIRNHNTWRNQMNIIIKTLTITASALMLTSGQIALADSIGEFAKGTKAEAFSSPVIRLVIAPNTESAKATVSYTNLNFESEEGVRDLYGLLQRASKEVCGSGTLQHNRVVTMKSSHLRCYREALSNAVNKIDNETLTRFHAG
jgi:UrcA family protein